MANTISELNNKIKVVDQEKESLLTAIRLIYDDTKANLLDRDADQTAYVSIPNKRKQPTTCSGMLTTVVASPLGINQYSPQLIEEVPNSNNHKDDNIPNATQVTKPTTRSDGNQTKRKHLNINPEAGTQTQKDQHRPRNEGSSKPKGQEPKINNMTTSQSWEIPC